MTILTLRNTTLAQYIDGIMWPKLNGPEMKIFLLTLVWNTNTID